MDGWCIEYPASVDSAFERKSCRGRNGKRDGCFTRRDQRVNMLFRIVDYVCQLAGYLQVLQCLGCEYLHTVLVYIGLYQSIKHVARYQSGIELRELLVQFILAKKNTLVK